MTTLTMVFGKRKSKQASSDGRFVVVEQRLNEIERRLDVLEQRKKVITHQ